MTGRISTFVILALSIASARFAVGETAEVLRLTDVIAEVRTNNPEIQAARERARAAAAAPAKASAYDDPTLAYEAWNAPESFNLRDADNNILRLSQKVPFPGKLALAGKIAERDTEVARRDLESTELDVVAAVKRAYYTLWQAHQNLLIYSRDRDLVQQFARITEQKYTVGQVSQPDVLRAQVERTRLINRVTTETLAIDSAGAELAALLSRGASGPLGVPEDPRTPRLDETAETLTELALRQRPELVAAQTGVIREAQRVRLARLDYLPDFEFTVGRFFNAGQRDGLGATASISLPFAYKYKYDAGFAEAEARLGSAKADLRRLENRVRKEVAAAFLSAKSALLQHELFVTTHIPQAEQALKASEIAYTTGKVDFLSLVDSVRAIESIHLEHIEASTEFEKAYADLERAVGKELTRSAL